jgi:mannose-6-phosphate isomerase-like protein (cupin superfamily)
MPDSIRKVNLAQAFARFSDRWRPRIIGALNGQHVKLAKIAGAFEFHHHANEDELFLVVRGRMRLEFRDSVLDLAEGELAIVPRGVEHRPVVAEGEAHILLFEPVGTLNTGNVRSDRTVSDPEWL